MSEAIAADGRLVVISPRYSPLPEGRSASSSGPGIPDSVERFPWSQRGTLVDLLTVLHQTLNNGLNRSVDSQLAGSKVLGA